MHNLLAGFLRGRQTGSTPEPPSGGMSIPIGGLPPNVTAGLRGAVTGPLHALGGLFGGGGSGPLSPTLFNMLRNALMKQAGQGASPSMPPPSPAQPMPPAWNGIAEGEPPPGTGLPGGQQQFPGLNEMNPMMQPQIMTPQRPMARYKPAQQVSFGPIEKIGVS